MPYDAFTIDTNAVIQGGMDFEAGLLAQLKQFKDGPTEFIISEIVVRETLKHLLLSTKKARDMALAAVNRAFATGLMDEPSREAAVAALKDSRAVARKRLSAFLEATGAETVPAKLCSIDDLVKSYFETTAPFEATGDKKHEFPDALALLSLQEWARSSGKTILAASGDNGWKAFAEASEHVFVEGDLAAALGIVQQHTEAATVAIEAFLQAIDDGALEETKASINDQLSDALVDWEFDVEAWSSIRYEVDQTELKFGSFELVKAGEQYAMTIVRLAADETVVRVEMEISATANADFSLYLWDSIDREELSMGGTSASSEETFEASVLLTIAGAIDGAPDQLEVIGVEVIDALGSVDMGEVEIDYGGDDDDYDQLQLELEAEGDEAGAADAGNDQADQPAE
ncbi:hypothetical protein GCM10011380_35660 [Sphingomonas metalli]|uniref:DUF4935 domain-containing protein n=1 Tax=Sphingomonas metalli TaxID=1779358 RepID=A0A916TF69_9SPHN|nr:PIN domain-containing protein [Sphingomonas metalli]GGB43041.1 hypothetical protein GCM10011380_35660 [Sphingomonas metalli]